MLCCQRTTRTLQLWLWLCTTVFFACDFCFCWDLSRYELTLSLSDISGSTSSGLCLLDCWDSSLESGVLTLVVTSTKLYHLLWCCCLLRPPIRPMMWTLATLVMKWCQDWWPLGNLVATFVKPHCGFCNLSAIVNSFRCREVSSSVGLRLHWVHIAHIIRSYKLAWL